MLCLVAQSCLTLCDPIDCSLPGSSIHGISQAIILKWFAIPFSSDRILSELSTKTCPSWVAYPDWLSFIELDKAVVHVIRLVSFCDCGFSLPAF